MYVRVYVCMLVCTHEQEPDLLGPRKPVFVSLTYLLRQDPAPPPPPLPLPSLYLLGNHTSRSLSRCMHILLATCTSWSQYMDALVIRHGHPDHNVSTLHYILATLRSLIHVPILAISMLLITLLNAAGYITSETSEFLAIRVVTRKHATLQPATEI